MAQELIEKKSTSTRWIMLIFWWAMILFALHASTHMVGAGDTWVAMACGRHFINHGVDTVEPFSANSHKPGPTPEEVKTWPSWAQWITEKVGLETVKFWHPTGWVNQNWLTHELFYWLTHLSPIADAETFDKPIDGQNISYDSLVYWKYALYIVTIIVVYYTSRLLGANPILAAVFSCFALFVGRTFLDIRPAGFTNLLTAVLLFIFVLTTYKNYLYIWLIVPTTVLWCNLHGGYIYVFAVLIPFIGLHLLMLLPKKIAACLYYILGWLFFFALAVKFRAHEYLSGIAKVESAGLFYFIAVLIAISITLTILKNIKPVLFHTYHIIATFIVFLTTVAMFYPPGLEMLMRQQLSKAYINDSRLTFFVAFIGFLIIAALLTAFKNRLKTISFKAWWNIVAAAVAAFILMIILNPFRLTNLTHTFIISVGEDAKLWKTVNEWHPAFEWSNPVGDEMPFLYMYILAWVLLALWAVCLLLKPRTPIKRAKNQPANTPIESQWPLIDLPFLVVAALTVYMAIGSRRFIPIAAIAACPVMAMFVETSFKMIAALVIRGGVEKADVESLFKMFKHVFVAVAFVIIAFLTVWWGYWYKTIYLNPWPDNYYLTSVFMRMSASYAKPFKACQFIRDNSLKGTVFNYWTEGGFVAYGQFPDPNTGKTPLQLYMDGRAQAAYNTAVYQRWMQIMNGGEPSRQVQSTGRSFTYSDYQAIGKWIDDAFLKENVSFVLMPVSQLDSPFIKGLDANPNWRIVYMDEEQRMYADVKTRQGKDLYIGLFTGQTKFPDEFSKLLTSGFNLVRLADGDKVNNGCEFMLQAFQLRPSQILTIELMQTANRYPQFRTKIAEVFSKYFDDFVSKKETNIKQDGYRERIIAAMLAGEFLANVNQDKPELVNKYRKQVKELSDIQRRINETTRW